MTWLSSSTWRRHARDERGAIVARGESDAIYADPQHEYTRKLLSAIPRGYAPRAQRARLGSAAAIVPAVFGTGNSGDTGRN